MKTFLLILIVICFCQLSHTYGQTRQENTGKSATIRLVHLKWSEGDWILLHSDTLILEVKTGQLFGDNNTEFMFRLKKIIDHQNIELVYPAGSMTPLGKNVNQTTNNTLIISGENNCFRIIDNNSISDYCIDVLKIT